MEISRKKNEATEISFAAVDSTTPANLKTGVSPVDTAYYFDGSWTALAISDTATEIGTTGMYQISLAQAEMNHDLIAIKFAVSGMADTMLIIRTRAVDLDDLVRATTPANTLDISATGEAGIDWANVGSPTTAVDLSATDIQLCDTTSTVTDGLVDSDILAQVNAALDTAYTDATSLNADGIKDRLRVLNWINRNKMDVTNASGNTLVYKDNSTTVAYNVAACLTDDSTNTVRLRLV